MSDPRDHSEDLPRDRPADSAELSSGGGASPGRGAAGIRSSVQGVAPPQDRESGPAVIAADGEGTPADQAVATLLEHSIDVPILAAAVEQQRPADAADTLEGLLEGGDDGDAGHLLVAMDDRKAAEALSHMEGPLAAGVVGDLLDEGRIEYASRLLDIMDPDDAVDLLQALGEPAQEQCLAALPRAAAAGLRRLLGYDEETAAGLMNTRFLVLRDGMSVGQATDAVRGVELPEHLTHLAVVAPDHRLVGVVGLRDLLVNHDDRAITSLMHHPRAIRADLDREHVARQFDRHDYQMMPVVDDRDRVIGIVTVDDVIDIIREEQTEDVQRSVGAGRQEAVSSRVIEKFRGRFPWLVISLIMMVPSALVVRKFEGIIGNLAVLAVLMPIVAAVTGNAGHQALAVTLRGIVLDEVRPGRVLLLVRREALAGVLNGVAIGLTLAGGIALLGLIDPNISWRIGVVGGVAIGGSIIAGTATGASVPLLMRRLGFDPAQSAAIFLIMITDTIAFAAFLGLAYLLFPWLEAGEVAAAPAVSMTQGVLFGGG